MKRQRSQSWEPSSFENSELIRQQSERPINDQNSIFSMIVNHNVIKEISIIDTYKEIDKISMHKKHFVNYVIKIKTDFIDYTIAKRYSEFEKLYDQMSTILHKLPKFPEKKLIKSNSTKNIAERREMLEQLLKYILRILNNQMHYFLHFLNIQQQFFKGGFGFNVRIHELSKDEFGLNDLKEETKLVASNDQEKMIFHYLAKLNERTDERSKIFQKMKRYFIGKTQHLGSQILKFMLVGDESRQKGIIELLKNTSQDFQSHISCVSGMQFLRKMLEHDYNPYAEFFLKVFAELSIKQLKKMGISFHVCGTNKQLCKQDTLLLIYKYVKVNDLKPEFISFLLDDKEALTEFQSFKEAYEQKKEEAFQLILDSNENFQKDIFSIKTSSKDKLSILDQEPSIEQLIKIQYGNKYKNMIIIAFNIFKAKLLRLFIPQNAIYKEPFNYQPNLNLSGWPTWQSDKQFNKLMTINKQQQKIYLCQDKQLFKKVAFFSEETLIINEDQFEIQVRPVQDYQQYEQFQKYDEISQKLQLTHGIYKNGTVFYNFLWKFYSYLNFIILYQFSPKFIYKIKNGIQTYNFLMYHYCDNNSKFV